MGYVFGDDELSPECGNFNAEVRSKSFYLYWDDDEYSFVEFDLQDIPKIRAILDIVEEHARS